VWTALKPYGVSFEQLSHLLSSSAAKVFHIDDRKGRIAPGMEADFVIWDPESFFNVSESNCFYRHKTSAFLGKQFYGEVCFGTNVI
jgi:allantoinase